MRMSWTLLRDAPFALSTIGVIRMVAAPKGLVVAVFALPKPVFEAAPPKSEPPVFDEPKPVVAGLF